MVYSVGILIFTAASTGFALLLSVWQGTLTEAVSWGAFLFGAVCAGAAVYHLKKRFTEKLSFTFFDGVMIFFFVLFCLRSFLWVYYIKGADFYTLHGYHYADLHFHLAFIQNFIEGARFWPENPLFPVSLEYHFGIDLFTAMAVKAGLPLVRALPLIGIVLGLVTMMMLYHWGRAFVLAGFLFTGGIAGYMAFTTGVFEDYQAGLAWKNLALTIFLPQRGFLYAFPAGLALLLSWKRRYLENREGLPFLVEGLLWGMMPLFQIHTFLFLSFIFIIWTVFSRKIRESTPVYLSAAIIATPLVLKLTNSFQKASYLWWKPGWMVDGENPFFFFFINFGLFIPLTIFTLIRVLKERDKSNALIFFPPFLLFLTCLFVMFCPWEWDNTKLMFWSYLMILPVMDRVFLSKVWRPLRFALVVSLFLSGFVSVTSALGKTHQGIKIGSREEVDGVCHALKGIPSDTRIAGAQEGYHPVLLCGRKLVAGYAGFLYGFAYSGKGVEQKLVRLMNGEFDWRDIARQLGVRYLFWGVHEKRFYPDSNQPWRLYSRKTAEGSWGELYDLAEPGLLPPSVPPLPPAAGQGLKAVYYSNLNWEGEPAVQATAGSVDFDWGDGGKPLPAPFSAVYEGEIYFNETGAVTLMLASDDGSKLEIGGEMILDNSGTHALRVRETERKFTAGWHRLKVFYTDAGGGASVRLWWKRAGRELEPVSPEFLRPLSQEAAQ